MSLQHWGTGNREVATVGGGECRGDSRIGVLAGVALRGWDCEPAWPGCLILAA